MPRMICLANSIREHGRCIAGIDTKAGEWVRPIPEHGGPIDASHTMVNGREIRPLDIVDLRLRKPTFGTKYQRENRIVYDWDWRLQGSVQPSAVRNCCDDETPILHSPDDHVAPAQLEQLPPGEWKSLQLVHAEPVTFCHDSFRQNRWRANFKDGSGNSYSLKITDPLFGVKLSSGVKVSKDCLLVVSLTEPWAAPGRLPQCWKLVATVIELT